MLQLETRTSIDKIQILCHENRIPASIEIQIGDAPVAEPDLKHAKFMTVGQLKMMPNVSPEMAGRQLQTIELVGGSSNETNKIKASFVKLILKQNHNDRGNTFNQVSLMGVCIYGIRHQDPTLPRRNSRSDVQDIVSRRKDLAFVMYTDSDVAEVHFYSATNLLCKERLKINFVFVA